MTTEERVPLVKQASVQAHYGVSRWTVDQWVAAGCPVRRQPSGFKRFDLAAVEAWIEAQTSARLGS